MRIVAIFAALVVSSPAGAGAGGPTVPGGFSIELEASGLGPLTQLAFGADGRLYAASLGGTVFACEYGPDGVASVPVAVASGVGQTLLGIVADPDGSLYVSSNDGANDTGFIARLRDLDGNGSFETEQRFITGLPNAGHHNDQLALDGRTLYFGMGSRTDDGEADNVSPVPAATLLSVDLDTVDFTSTANLPSVYATGLRNAFGVTVDENGNLWAGDNGRDSPQVEDTLHRVRPGRHHGFPSELAPPDAVAPIAQLGLGTSADGCDFYPTGGRWGADYARDLFQARFDFNNDDPGSFGMDVIRVQLDRTDPNHPVATVSVFGDGFDTPLDVQVDPCGHLLVAEFSGRIYRIARNAWPLTGDANRDCAVNLTDLAVVLAGFGGSGAAVSAADLNGDCVVDLSDLAIVLGAFGQSCP